jgi:hypothetical protein
MTLPSLKLPVHIIELPVSKKKVEIRPYVIKEEGSILTTLQSNDEEEVFSLFKRIINSCLLDETLIIEELNMPDFFFLLLQIRMKSNGEVIDGSGKCSGCGKGTEFSVNIEESIVIENEDKIKDVVNVTDNIQLKICLPVVSNLFSMDEKDLFKSSMDLVAASIDTVIFDKKVYQDFTKEDLIENILGNLTKKQFAKITDAIDGLVKIKVALKYVCNSCGAPNIEEVSDLVNFA